MCDRSHEIEGYLGGIPYCTCDDIPAYLDGVVIPANFLEGREL